MAVRIHPNTSTTVHLPSTFNRGCRHAALKEEQIKCLDKLVQGEASALLGELPGRCDILVASASSEQTRARDFQQSLSIHLTYAFHSRPLPSFCRAGRCGIAQFLPPAPQAHSPESLPPPPPLPAAAAAAFVSEVSASDFVSGGSRGGSGGSGGGSSGFGAISDVDVKAAALSACDSPPYPSLFSPGWSIVALSFCFNSIYFVLILIHNILPPAGSCSCCWSGTRSFMRELCKQVTCDLLIVTCDQ